MHIAITRDRLGNRAVRARASPGSPSMSRRHTRSITPARAAPPARPGAEPGAARSRRRRADFDLRRGHRRGLRRSGDHSRRPGADHAAERRRLPRRCAPYRRSRSWMPQGTIDGGDILAIGTRVFVGRCSRTNRSAMARWDQSWRPTAIRCSASPSVGAYHLKSAVTAIASDTLLIDGRWAPAVASRHPPGRRRPGRADGGRRASPSQSRDSPTLSLGRRTARRSARHSRRRRGSRRDRES